MRRFFLALLSSALLVAGAIAPAGAGGTLALSWDRPAGPGQPPITQRSYTGPGPVEIFVSVYGLDTTIQGARAELKFGAMTFFDIPVPDAWRFDEAGCQAGGICFAGGGLGSAMPDPVVSEVISDYTYDSLARTARAIVAERYPFPLTPDPSRTYTLFRFRFELSGTCAGADAPMVISFAHMNPSYLVEMGGQEIFFSLQSWALGWNDPVFPFGRAACFEPQTSPPTPWARDASLLSEIPSCDVVVPSTSTSWGKLKSTYR